MKADELTVTKPLASERSYSRGGTAGAATKRHGRAGAATAGRHARAGTPFERARQQFGFEEDAHRKCSL